MSLVAVISRTPHLQMAEWVQHTQSMEELVKPASREVRNPFTNKSTMLEANTGTVEIVVSGTAIGAIEPSPEFDEDGELHVFAPEGPHDALDPIVTAIAKALGAEVQWARD